MGVHVGGGEAHVLWNGWLAGAHACRHDPQVGGAVERWLGTPSLVRETSRFSIWKPKTWKAAPAKGAEEVKRDFRCVWGCGRREGRVARVRGVRRVRAAHRGTEEVDRDFRCGACGRRGLCPCEVAQGQVRTRGRVRREGPWDVGVGLRF